MKKHRLTAGLIAAVFLLAGCTADTTSAPAEKSSDDNVVETQTDSTDKAVTDMSSTTITNATLPEELAAIPQDYLSESDQPGTLVELEYDTYESMTYSEKDLVIHKRAIVYLPYGYSEDIEYNVFYLMHGGWSDETTYLGTPDYPSEFKNVLDNAMADGKILPMIVVCPTYNNESNTDSSSYSLALQLTDNYHNELINDLIPAAEGTYSTYADSTTPEGISASEITVLSAVFPWGLSPHGIHSSTALTISAIFCRPAGASLPTGNTWRISYGIPAMSGMISLFSQHPAQMILHIPHLRTRSKQWQM